MSQTILLQQLSVNELKEILREILQEEIHHFVTKVTNPQRDVLLTRVEACEF